MSSVIRIALCFVLVGACATAQDTSAPPPVPAPTEAIPAFNPQQAQLRFDSKLGTGSGSIIEQSKIELLDIEQLRAIYERTGEDQTLKLSLADCLALALKQNNDILIAEFDPQSSDADIYTAKGEFDPVSQTSVQYLNARQTVNQQLARFGGITSIRQYQTTINSSIGGKLHTGTQYAVVFDMTKEENTYGRYVEDFDSNLSLQLTQPLLRGLGRGYNTYKIRAARNMKELNEWQLRLTVMNTVSQVIKSYWDLVGAVEAVKVAQGSLENAKRLLTINQTRRDIGTAADLDVLQAKAGVSSRQNDVVNATARAVDAGDILKQLLDLRDGDFLSKRQIVPLDRPAKEPFDLKSASTFDSEMDQYVAEALEKRPEIKIADLTIANAEIDADKSRKDLLPEVDLTGSISQGGRDHYLRKSLEGIPQGNDAAFTYGIKATVPLGNRAARGAYERAEIREKQAGQQMQKARTGIMTNVHLAVRNVETNRILVKNSEQAVTLQQASVGAEEERLRLGVTTSWQVLQIQEALTAAQTQELQARVAYEKARVDLQLAKGTLLDDVGITYDAPESEKPVGFFEGYKKAFKE